MKSYLKKCLIILCLLCIIITGCGNRKKNIAENNKHMPQHNFKHHGKEQNFIQDNKDDENQDNDEQGSTQDDEDGEYQDSDAQGSTQDDEDGEYQDSDAQGSTQDNEDGENQDSETNTKDQIGILNSNSTNKSKNNSNGSYLLAERITNKRDALSAFQAKKDDGEYVGIAIRSHNDAMFTVTLFINNIQHKSYSLTGKHPQLIIPCKIDKSNNNFKLIFEETYGGPLDISVRVKQSEKRLAHLSDMLDESIEEVPNTTYFNKDIISQEIIGTTTVNKSFSISPAQGKYVRVFVDNNNDANVQVNVLVDNENYTSSTLNSTNKELEFLYTQKKKDSKKEISITFEPLNGANMNLSFGARQFITKPH